MDGPLVGLHDFDYRLLNALDAPRISSPEAGRHAGVAHVTSPQCAWSHIIQPLGKAYGLLLFGNCYGQDTDLVIVWKR